MITHNTTVVPISIQGMVASIRDDHYPLIHNLFLAQQKVSKRNYGGRHHKEFTTEILQKSIVQQMGKYHFVGCGAIKYLMQSNPWIKFKIEKVVPERTRELSEIVIPEKIKSHPNFLLNGKPRDTYYDSLEACRVNPNGVVKLPPQSGKTAILLTLGYNMRQQVGSGVIIVTTDNLRKQLIRRAKEYGTDEYFVTYEEYSKLYEKGTLDESKSWVIVATPSLLSRRNSTNKLYNRDTFKWLIFDECHRVSSPTGQSLYYMFPNLVRSYGFSATYTKSAVPENLLTFNKVDYEDALRISSFGKIIYERKTSDMIKEGSTNKTVLINFVYRWNYEDLSAMVQQIGKEYSASSYHSLLELLGLNKDRMRVLSDIQTMLNQTGRNTMMNVSRRSYGFSMLDTTKRKDTVAWYGSSKVYIPSLMIPSLKDFNAKAVTPSDSTSYELYKNVYESKVLSSSNLNQYYGNLIKNVISSASVGGEGVSFDIPVNACILAEGKGTNRITVIQRAGRTSSATSDKTSVIINIVDEDAPPVLRKHSVTRATSIKQEYGIKPIVVNSLDELQKVLTTLD